MWKIDRLYSALQFWARTNIPNVTQIFGSNGVGKTTFFEQIKHRQESPSVALKTQQVITEVCKDERTNIEFRFSDVGGEPYYLIQWLDLIRQDPPLGIIFLIDHESKRMGLNALTQVRSALEQNKNRKAITKGLLFFINKYDLWKDNENPKDLCSEYESELSKLRHIGIQPIVRWGSAKNYTIYPKHFDQALSDLYDLMFITSKTKELFPQKNSIYYE